MRNLPFDVFLSYNSKDIDIVRQIDEELTAAKVKTWFDKRQLRPGETWLEGLYRGLEESRCAAIFLGPSGTGRQQKDEVQKALKQAIKEGRAIIPVILPGVEKIEDLEMPAFLEEYHWVDCRNLRISQSSLDTLIWGVTGKKPIRSIPQMGEPFLMRIGLPGKPSREATVHTLPRVDPNLLVDLTWETFGKGIDILCEQIQNYGTRLGVDACIGINDAGLVMATFLASRALDNTKVGYVRSKGSPQGRIVVEDACLFPELNENPSVMLMDFEVKSGSGVKKAIERVFAQYGQGTTIYFAVFSAMTELEDLRVPDIDGLVSASVLPQLGIEDLFLACTMQKPGIEPPFKLR